jgi:hypothetical protein
MTFSDLLATADRVTLDILGDSVTYAPTTGAAVVVTGIFDSAYVRVDAGHAGVSSTGPAVFLLLADLPSDPAEDAATITVESVQYEIREVQKSQGAVLLFLHRV